AVRVGLRRASDMTSSFCNRFQDEVCTLALIGQGPFVLLRISKGSTQNRKIVSEVRASVSRRLGLPSPYLCLINALGVLVTETRVGHERPQVGLPPTIAPQLLVSDRQDASTTGGLRGGGGASVALSWCSNDSRDARVSSMRARMPHTTQDKERLPCRSMTR